MPATPDANPEVLTLAEANAALPQVIHLLERLQELQRAMLEHEQPRAAVTHTLAGGNGRSQTALPDQLLAEIAQCGAMVKDLESGLVDFYGERAGKRIFLCWRLGEEMRVQHWHTLEGGFAGRQPVDALIR